jgi:UDP-N-acetylglucosamine:LPS N-acetylglucosamine transferase
MMRVLVFGSKNYKDYNELIRQITVLIDDRKHFYPEDKQHVFIHGGSQGAENMVTEYIGKVEKFLRQKGFSIKEEIIRLRSSLDDVSIIEKGADFALIFGHSDRNKSCQNLLDVYGIPYRYVD